MVLLGKEVLDTDFFISLGTETIDVKHARHSAVPQWTVLCITSLVTVELGSKAFGVAFRSFTAVLEEHDFDGACVE